MPEAEPDELPAGLALAAGAHGGGGGSGTPTRSPLTAKLLGAVADTLAYSAHAAAAPHRSSVAANA